MCIYKPFILKGGKKTILIAYSGSLDEYYLMNKILSSILPHIHSDWDLGFKWATVTHLISFVSELVHCSFGRMLGSWPLEGGTLPLSQVSYRHEQDFRIFVCVLEYCVNAQEEFFSPCNPSKWTHKRKGGKGRDITIHSFPPTHFFLPVQEIKLAMFRSQTCLFMACHLAPTILLSYYSMTSMLHSGNGILRVMNCLGFPPNVKLSAKSKSNFVWVSNLPCGKH